MNCYVAGLQLSIEVGLNVLLWGAELKLPPHSLILIKIFSFIFLSCLLSHFFPSFPFFFHLLLWKCIVCVSHSLSPLPFLSCDATRPLSWLLLPTSFSFFRSLQCTLISSWKLSWCVSSFFFIFHCKICFHLCLRFFLPPYVLPSYFFLLLLYFPVLCFLSSRSLNVWQRSCKTACSHSLTCLQGNTRQFGSNVICTNTLAHTHTHSLQTLALSLCSTDRLWNDYLKEKHFCQRPEGDREGWRFEIGTSREHRLKRQEHYSDTFAEIYLDRWSDRGVLAKAVCLETN